MQKITPHLWFDTEAKEAADFYTSIFPNSRVTNTTVIKDTPSGDCDVVSFELKGISFQAISAGPIFKFNPSQSLMVNFDPSKDADASTKIDEVWQKLSEGGKVLMEIDEYPFSKRYGWIQDKYGLSWQLILTNPEGEERPDIIPAFLFKGDMFGKAEEASDFYISVFKNAKGGNGNASRGALAKYPAGAEPNVEGTTMFTDFKLENMWFAAMDGPGEHNFSFNEAISYIVSCETQEEIDYFFEKLSAVPESEQCGWLKDKYGVSWQIVPSIMDEMMKTADEETLARVVQAFLQMKKFDIAKLEEAFRG